MTDHRSGGRISDSLAGGEIAQPLEKPELYSPAPLDIRFPADFPGLGTQKRSALTYVAHGLVSRVSCALHELFSASC